MNNSELEDALVNEIKDRVDRLTTRIDRIGKDLLALSSEALELNTYLTMAKHIPQHNLSEECSMKPSEFKALSRACKLTKNSPTINRSLLVRFSIIP
jgi:hypothetical protein